MKLQNLFWTLGAVTLLNGKAAEYIAYDNSVNYQGTVTDRGNIEVGDEINLTGGAATMTRFQFEYFSSGTSGAATGVVRFYDLQPVSGVRVQPFQPGNLLFQSQPFVLQDGFHQGSIDNLSLDIPGRFVWSVSFSGIAAGARAGLLFYNGVDPGSAEGQSFDDHWEVFGDVSDPTPRWQLVDTAGIIDNFGARVTAIPSAPEPSTVTTVLSGGVMLLGARFRRSHAERRS